MQRGRQKKGTKKHDARAELLFCLSTLLLFCSSRCRRRPRWLRSRTTKQKIPAILLASLLANLTLSGISRMAYHGCSLSPETQYSADIIYYS